MTTVLLDDHLLLEVLLGREPDGLRTTGSALATTGLWYHRLCRALCHDSVVGSLSRQLSGVDESVARLVIDAVTELPESIEVLSLRDLGWPMAELAAGGHRLNLLSLEVIAAAKQLSAEICLSSASTGSPLHNAALDEELAVRIVEVGGG